MNKKIRELNKKVIEMELDRLYRVKKVERLPMRYATTKSLASHISYVKNGRVYPHSFRFSYTLLNMNNIEVVKQIVRHEFAHYLANMERGKNEGHNLIFEEKCKEINCKYNTPYFDDEELHYTKYEVYCKGCNKIVARYNSKSHIPKYVIEGDCITSCCDKGIVIKQLY